MRDDFSASTKRIIAQRVNYHCSNPLCIAPTVGPKTHHSGVTNVGVAAHITAASPRGKRYNPLLSSAERKSPENGLWCCQICGKKIDDDEIRYTETLLKEWKNRAEERASGNLGRSVFERADAPTLILHMGSPLQKTTDPFSLRLSGEIVPHLCSLMPEKFHQPFDSKIINSGYGALGQPYAIVGAALNHGWEWNVGFFNAGEFGWELVASIHLEGQKAWPPEASYVPGTPGAIALTHVHSYGTGVFRRSTSWYRIAKGEPQPLLSYPHEFHVYGWGMPFGRKLTSSHVQMPESLSMGELLKIKFDISYSIYDELFTDSPEDRLFADSETLSLEWDAMTGGFMPHTASDNPVRIEALWEEGTRQFVERNRAALEHVARSGTTRQKNFISEQLAWCPATTKL